MRILHNRDLLLLISMVLIICKKVMGDVMHYVLIVAVATILPTLAMHIMFVLVPVDTYSMYTCVMLISIFRRSNYRLLISRRYDTRCISRLSDTKLKHDDNGLYFTGRDVNYILYRRIHVHACACTCVYIHACSTGCA